MHILTRTQGSVQAETSLGQRRFYGEGGAFSKAGETPALPFRASADQKLPGHYCDENYEAYGVADQSSLLNLLLFVHSTPMTILIIPHPGSRKVTFFNRLETQSRLVGPPPPEAPHRLGFLRAIHAMHRV
jgi:hypothetical protein